MSDLNKVFLLGNLTKDPEVRFTPAGKAVGELRMAINRKYKTANNETKDETCFVSVVVWGRQAETCGEYLKKGSQLLVEGRLQYDEWEKEGKKQNRIRVVAERVQFLGKPRGGSEFGDGGGSGEPREKQKSVEEGGADRQEPPAEGDSDNLPF